MAIRVPPVPRIWGPGRDAALFSVHRTRSWDNSPTSWDDFAAEAVQNVLKSPLLTTLGSHQWNQDFTGKHGFQGGD